MKISLILVYSATVLYSITATAGPTKIDCPREIKVTESVTAVDSSWSATRNEGGRYILDSVSVYSGHPRGMASLIPDKSVVRHLRRVSTWNFIASEKEEHWMACSYINSLTLLTKALPKNYKKCELTTELLPTGAKLSVESFACE